VDEFELIRKYFVRPDGAEGVVVGIGDDGAVLLPDPDRELVTVVDTLVANVHFPEATNAFDIGYRSVAINISDIAAMGARPRWMTLALTLLSADEDWLQGFAEGLRAAAAEHDVALVGGDTTSGDRVVVSVQVIGDVAPGAALLRSGAEVGDTIYVTGTVGDAAAGLELLNAGTPDETLGARFLRPTARVSYGQALVGIASAAIDVSDGLYGDLQKLLSASGVGGVIDLDSLPISEVLRSKFDTNAQREFALSGGDDYELCFTASETLPDPDDLRVTAIGSVTEGSGIVCREGGNVVQYDDSGYLHFL
jgi:thiamine-monophosphate kinase